MLLPDENKRMTRDRRRQLMQVTDKEETERVRRSESMVEEVKEKRVK